ncbi:sensor histidine kinase [Rhodococcus phenolicus]|uniref:sensor histidine kinase n=1 Tax=Rhodococcus phenolicus TaxID=263849 RepID=UPI000A75EF87|nr:ATP-binding protein [Rhodococcus phenolicus]
MIRRVRFGGGSSAADRFLRVFVRFVVLGYLFYLVPVAGYIVDAAALVAAWWTPLAVTAIVGSALAMGAATFHPDVSRIRRAAAVNAWLFVAVAVLWWPAWNGGHLATDDSMWLTLVPGLPALSAVAAWRTWRPFAYLAVVEVLVHTIDRVVRDLPFDHHMLPDIAFVATYSVMFVGAATVGLGAGRTLDATIATTHATASAAAAAEAKSAERARFAALVHDRVMSTLLSAGRRETDERVVGQARRAVAELDDLRVGSDPQSGSGLDAVVARLRSAATEVDENVTFAVNVSADGSAALYPRDAVGALTAALAEAVRNSVRHAGPEAVRAVTVDAAPGALTVTAADDGVGFDPARIGDRRLGIAVSIGARMRALDGGDATVASAPREGTIVTLTWQEPQR